CIAFVAHFGHPDMAAIAAADATPRFPEHGNRYVIFGRAFRTDDFHDYYDYTKTMKPFQRLILTVSFLSTCLWAEASAAADRPVCSSATDRACIARSILFDMEGVNEMQWRDATLRDLAGSLTYDGKIDQAVGLIDRIKSPDTQAMTIR